MLDYRECSTCSQKSGMALLCATCLHNRKIVSELQKNLAYTENVIKLYRKLMPEHHNTISLLAEKR